MHRYSVDIFHILVLWEYWVLTESRILFQPMLGAWELSHFPLVVMKRLNKSKKEGKDQESIQSSTAPDPGYQWESDNFKTKNSK